MSTTSNRREFVRTSIGSVAAGAAAGLTPSFNAFGANEAVNLGFIAAGGRNMDHIRGFLRVGGCNIVAICDVDQERLDRAVNLVGGGVKPYRDLRHLLDDPDVDAVVIGTPDHWHCTATILACQAGKDVFVEKALGHHIREEQLAVQAVRQYDRVGFICLQQRSGPHFIEAKEIIRSGRLGKITTVHAFNQWGTLGMGHQGIQGLGIHPDEPAPPTVDYDLWLGPAPLRPFNRNRFHFSFYFNWDYCGGMTISWGIHLFDIVQWVMGTDVNRVSVSGGRYVYEHNVDTPDALEAVFDCPGYTLTYSLRQANGFSLHGGMDHGIYFFGTDGTLFINRNRYELYSEDDRQTPVEVGSDRGQDDPHKLNFLECVKTRERTDSDIETGFYSGVPAHLANIAYRTGRSITWDNAAKTIPNDPEAARLLYREPRDPWKLSL